jgi:hypothetical protein
VETRIQAATRQNANDRLAAEGQSHPRRRGRGRLRVQHLVTAGALGFAGLGAPHRGLPTLDRPDTPFEIGEMLWITSAAGGCRRKTRRRKRLADTGDVRSFQRAWERLFRRLERYCRGQQGPLDRGPGKDRLTRTVVMRLPRISLSSQRNRRNRRTILVRNATALIRVIEQRLWSFGRPRIGEAKSSTVR